MIDDNHKEADILLKEAELLLEAYGWCPDEHRLEIIESLAKSIIDPLVVDRNPRALWLKSTLGNLGEQESLSENQFDALYLDLIKESAQGNCAEAQYLYGCHLYEHREHTEAVALYRLSAQQGFAPAQWCLGLDTLNGVGVEKNQELGLSYIRLSAEQQYQYAVEFMVRETKERNYGLLAQEADKWALILSRLE